MFPALHVYHIFGKSGSNRNIVRLFLIETSKSSVCFFYTTVPILRYLHV